MEPVFAGLSDHTGFGYRDLSLMQVVEMASVPYEFKDSASQQEVWPFNPHTGTPCFSVLRLFYFSDTAFLFRFAS